MIPLASLVTLPPGTRATNPTSRSSLRSGTSRATVGVPCGGARNGSLITSSLLSAERSVIGLATPPKWGVERTIFSQTPITFGEREILFGEQPSVFPVCPKRQTKLTG